MQKIEQLQAAVVLALNVVAKASQASKSNKGEAVAACRKVAAEGAALGFSHETVGKVWQAVAKMEKRPSGTWKPYTKHVQGFVILAEKGINLETGGKEGKPVTQGEAVEAHKVATTPQAILDEAKRISDAAALFRLRIGGELVTGFDWKRPDADTVAEVLSMLEPHPTETADVKVTKADKDAAEAAELLAALAKDSEADETTAEPARTGTDG